MAQFLKARFLSEALKWKADPRHASDQFFAGLRYNPFLFQQARLTFPEYDKRFPAPANQEFVENFARDLANPTRNQELLKIINPEILTPELEAANSQFEVSAGLEQQSAAQASGQPVAQPFSLTTQSAPTMPRVSLPRIIVPPTTTQAAPTTETPPTRLSFQVPRIPPALANTIKNLGSKIGVFFQRNVGKYITAGRVATVVSGGIGAITGGALTNGSAIGMLGGGGLGAIAPSWIRSGEGTKFLGRVGNGAINFGANLSNQVSSGATRLSMSSGSKKWALGLLGAFILFFGISLIGTTPSGKAGPLPPPGGSGCPDTSGNRNPAICHYLNPSINLFDTNISQSAIDSYINKYSSIFINAGKGDLNEFKRRVDYIVNNAKAAGLNPTMFLGYWKTESKFSTMGNRDMGCKGTDFYNQVDCALGINAFTTPNTNPIANCAKSKDANSVACQALKSIRAKSNFDTTHPINYPIKTFDDFAEAYGPYDDLIGGQPTNCTHTYNELIDMAKELRACTPQAPTVTPLPADKLQQAIIDQFGVTMIGFDTQHLQWAYTKFSDVSQTKFIQLISGTKITAISGDYSRQTGCKSINLGQYQPEELFKVIITHELGHIIANCSSWLEAQRIKHFVALSLEGPLTYYARNAQSCTGSDTNSEDYADMLTYYLNPNSGAQSAPCDRGNPNPYTNGQFPMHRNVAQEVLGRYP